MAKNRGFVSMSDIESESQSPLQRSPDKIRAFVGGADMAPNKDSVNRDQSNKPKQPPKPRGRTPKPEEEKATKMKPVWVTPSQAEEIDKYCSVIPFSALIKQYLLKEGIITK